MRERGEPIRFFGESDLDSFKRLSLIETSEPKENGMRNDFRAAMDKSEQDSLNEIMNIVDTDRSSDGSSHDVEVKDDEINFNEILVKNYFKIMIKIDKISWIN